MMEYETYIVDPSMSKSNGLVPLLAAIAPFSTLSSPAVWIAAAAELESSSMMWIKTEAGRRLCGAHV